MKKFIFISLLCLVTIAWVSAQKKGDTLYVNVKEAPVKSSTGFFARTSGKLAYGVSVRVLAVSGKWVQIQSVSGASLSGWVTSANLTSKRITQSGSSSVSGKEMAMAGKAFNEEVEEQYKTTDKDLNYSAVDNMERISVSEQDLLSFIEEGRLAKGE
jgi:uncharacterized protein YgiM (DUF1202 family)